MTQPGAPLSRFEIASGELRGSQLSLHPAWLEHRADAQLETIPLAAVSSVRVAFERDAARIRWAIVLLVLALIVFALAGPLESLAGAAGREMAAQQAGGGTGVAGALLALFRVVEAAARLFPLLAAALALGASALAALGWLGTTTLAITFAGGERAFPVRGRNAEMLDFCERVAEQVVAIKK